MLYGYQILKQSINLLSDQQKAREKNSHEHAVNEGENSMPSTMCMKRKDARREGKGRSSQNRQHGIFRLKKMRCSRHCRSPSGQRGKIAHQCRAWESHHPSSKDRLLSCKSLRYWREKGTACRCARRVRPLRAELQSRLELFLQHLVGRANEEVQPATSCCWESRVKCDGDVGSGMIGSHPCTL